MKLVIRSASVRGNVDLRSYAPESLGEFAELVTLDIGPKNAQRGDTFSIRVATPSGLDGLSAHDGILATRPLLVMRRYDYDDLRRWLEHTVERCEAERWPDCVENLRRFFDWDYAGYSEAR